MIFSGLVLPIQTFTVCSESLFHEKLDKLRDQTFLFVGLSSDRFPRGQRYTHMTSGNAKTFSDGATINIYLSVTTW